MLDRNGFVGSILMNLTKAYDYLPHNLLLAKLQAYGFSKGSIRLFLSYLTNHIQRINIDSSDWTNILNSILQRSILGPLLLIFLSMICSFSQQNVKSVTLPLFFWYGFR